MDEDLVIDTPNEIVEDAPTPEVDPYEEKAREEGWKPKEEYEGDPTKWRPAKEFVERGELFGKIDTLGKELKDTKKALRMLQDHHSKVKETEYKRAVDELKALQKKHLEEGNSDGYLEATDLLTDIKAEQKAREQFEKSIPAQPDPRFVDWVNSNPWYAQDPKMREYADNVGAGYAARNPNADPMDVLAYVKGEVKERFANRFQNPNRTKPTPVEGSGNSAPKKEDKFTLTEDEIKVGKTFIRQGVFKTMDEWKAEVKRSRGEA